LERTGAKLSTETTSSKEVQATKEQIEEEYKQMKERVFNLRKKIEREEEEIKTLNERLAQNEDDYRTMERKLYEGNEQIAKLTSRRDMLQDLRDNYQGFFHGVKEVLKAKRNDELTDIYGAVVDLIDVPERYMTAIDTVLGAQAQHIVVHSERAAREAIGWLKKKNAGRATFLPLDAIEKRKIPDTLIAHLRDESGFIGVASDLVDTNQTFNIVAEYVLGNVIATEKLRQANEIARKTNRRYRIVTLDGDIVFPGGSMSGGAKRKGNESLFTREKKSNN